MGNKIELPPKVKCWRCEGTGDITVKGGLLGACDCVTEFGSRGERYVFDDLAAAVDGIEFEIGRPRKVDGKWIITIEDAREIHEGKGSNPTTVLLNVITKFNE